MKGWHLGRKLWHLSTKRWHLGTKRWRLGTVVALTLIPSLILPVRFFHSLLEGHQVILGFPHFVNRLDGNRVQRIVDQKKLPWQKLLSYNSSESSLLPGDHRAHDEVHLYMPGPNYTALIRDLPQSGEQFQKAYVIDDGRMIEGRIRIRGNSGWHWLYEKKSFKMRLPRRSLFRGSRDISLSIKKPLEQSWINEIALRFGLLAPELVPVKTFLNGRFYGIHRYTGEVNEDFLRKIGRLPGTIYKGENAVSTNEYHYGLRTGFQLRNPYVWGKHARDNTLPRDYRGDLIEMIRLVSVPGLEALEALRGFFDEPTMQRQIAFNLLLGNWHSSRDHNQKFYLDPSDGHFYPVLWDSYLFDNSKGLSGGSGTQHDYLLDAIHHRLGADPRFMHAALTALHRKMAELPEILADLDAKTAFIHDNPQAVRLDPGSPHFAVSLSHLDKARGILQQNVQLLDLLFTPSRLQWRQSGQKLALGTESLAGARLTSLLVSGLAVPERAIRLDIDRGFTVSETDQLPAYSVTAQGEGLWLLALEEPLLLLPHYVGRNRTQTRLAPYSVLLADGLEVVNLEVENGLTGAPGQTEEVNDFRHASPDAHHAWDFHPKPQRSLTADHPVHHVQEDFFLGPHQTWVIKPGTTIRLGPDVSIVSRGKILAEGTPQEPIVFEAAEEGTVWGTLALQGEGASASSFRHVSFRRGSRALIDRVRYPGMVTVHHALDVVFDQCHFSGNLVGDDGLRTAHSNVKVTGSVFEEMNSDAIDFDYSRGEIAGNLIRGVGNDGIDLMGSTTLVRDNRIEDCGDKGISIGEGSEPLIVNNLIRRSAIGVQIKDRSHPLMIGNTLESCEVGLDGMKKNWRYGDGGHGRFFHGVLRGNRKAVQLDEHSSMLVAYSDAEGLTPGPRLFVVGLGEDGLSSGELEPLFSLGSRRHNGFLESGSTLKIHQHGALDHFQDGYAPVSASWRSAGPLFVKSSALHTRLSPGQALERDFADPEGGHVVLLMSAQPPSRISISSGEGSQVVELAGFDRQVALPTAEVRIEADRPTTLRIRRTFQVADPG